jgi:hypothetical protein
VNYSWVVDSLETSGELNFEGYMFQNSVRAVRWQRVLTGPDDRSESFAGRSEFSAIDRPKNDFILYGNLYEDQIVGWIEAVVSPEEVKEIDRKLLVKYNKVPREKKKLPW